MHKTPHLIKKYYQNLTRFFSVKISNRIKLWRLISTFSRWWYY